MMRKNLSIVVLSAGILFSCKTQKEVIQDGMSPISGKVSHMYRESGCKTVILALSPESDSLVLIPSNSLGAFDVDGLEISFTYRMLRMPNPEGCSVGNPAEIVSIKKK